MTAGRHAQARRGARPTTTSRESLSSNRRREIGPRRGMWRPRPESNRGARICSPLRHHSATRPSPWRYQTEAPITRSRGAPRQERAGVTSFAWTLPVLAAALLLDRLVGDPEWLWRRVPHPVVLIGRAIDRLEARLNVPDAPFSARRRHGALAISVLVLAGGTAAGLIERGFAAMPFGW